MPVNKSVMNRHRDRHHQFAFPYDGFSGIQQRVVIAASLLLCAGDGSKIQVGSRTSQNQSVISVGYFSVFCCIRITVFGDGVDN